MRRFAKCLRCIHGAPPHTPPKGTFCKKSPWESRKTTFDFYVWFIYRLLPRYRKTGVHAAYSPSAASSCQAVFMRRRPKPRQRRLFVKSPLWNPEKQRLTFIVWFFIVCSQGIKRPAYMPPTRLRLQAAISCIHGAPPQTPPKGTFCKKSPLESRKTAFDFYCLVFHRLLSRYQKAGVHAAYSPSAASSYQLYSWGAAPNPAKGDFL